MRSKSNLTRVLGSIAQSPALQPVALVYLRFLRLLESIRAALLPTEIAALEAIMGNYLAQAVYVAVRLGIPEALASGPRSVADLAQATGAQPDPLFRLLRFLAAKRLVRQQPDGLFRLTRHGRGLIGDAAGSFKAFAEMNGSPASWRAWGALLDGVRRGEPPFELAHGGRALFEYMRGDAEFAEMFDRAMVGFSEATIPLIASAYGFGPGTLVDVGGGRGALLAGILGHHPQLRGVLYDLPEVLGKAPAYLAGAGVEGRVELVGGSFFDSVPEGHDYYILKNILQDWDDRACSKILANVARAIKPGGRLLLAEMLVHEREAYPLSKAMDVGMLVLGGGRQRTALQIKAMLAESGFVLQRVVGGTDFTSVLVAEPRRR